MPVTPLRRERGERAGRRVRARLEQEQSRPGRRGRQARSSHVPAMVPPTHAPISARLNPHYLPPPPPPMPLAALAASGRPPGASEPVAMATGTGDDLFRVHLMEMLRMNPPLPREQQERTLERVVNTMASQRGQHDPQVQHAQSLLRMFRGVACPTAGATSPEAPPAPLPVTQGDSEPTLDDSSSTQTQISSGPEPPGPQPVTSTPGTSEAPADTGAPRLDNIPPHAERPQPLAPLSTERAIALSRVGASHTAKPRPAFFPNLQYVRPGGPARLGDIVPQTSQTRPSPFAPVVPKLTQCVHTEQAPFPAGTSPAPGPQTTPAPSLATPPQASSPTPFPTDSGVTQPAPCALAASGHVSSVLGSVAVEFPDEERRLHLDTARILTACSTQLLLRLSILCQQEISSRLDGARR